MGSVRGPSPDTSLEDQYADAAHVAIAARLRAAARPWRLRTALRRVARPAMFYEAALASEH
ncbi:MAG: hypothetical protein JOY89_20335 [Solirubrobacterales bacterium]|nr:hypothetical protein [Solirubrobacterales bacterium]